jgi:cytochrome c-type biogenesis protein CcmH
MLSTRVTRALLAVLLALGLQAALSPFPAAADTLDEEVRRIAKQLRCPICESVSVADSPAELAGQMRGVIRKKLEAGESEQQIVDYFVAAYGDAVLLEPPRRGLGWAVWLGPLIVLAAGAAILWLVLRAWARNESRIPSPESREASGRDSRLGTGDSIVSRARRELDAVRKGLSG